MVPDLRPQYGWRLRGTDCFASVRHFLNKTKGKAGEKSNAKAYEGFSQISLERLFGRQCHRLGNDLEWPKPPGIAKDRHG